jgi:cytochrome c peroxidase
MTTRFIQFPWRGFAGSLLLAACGTIHGMAQDGADAAAKPALQKRPLRSAAERTTWVATLRDSYARPPIAWPAPHVDEGVRWQEIGRLPAVPHPAANPHSHSKEALGKSLFFDPRLSGSGHIACASCHDPDLGWADGRTVSFGHLRKPLARNAPTIRNIAFQPSLFWDGRSASVEEQAEAVLLNPTEMHVTPEQVVAALTAIAEYRALFAAAFADDEITFRRTAEALACFQRTVVGGHSRFDRFMTDRRDALSDDELIGLDLFRREARCMNCHHGPMFSDGGFHNLGLSYYSRQYEDRGRFVVTQEVADMGRFRTPTLRDVTRTTPLMHNGLFELSGVLNMYNAGMPTLRRQDYQHDDPLFPLKSPHLRPLGLNRQDLADLAAFLGTLEEPRHRVRPPLLPAAP